MLFCAGCGTALSVSGAKIESPPIPVPKRRSRVLNASSATFVLFIYLAVQFFCGFFASGMTMLILSATLSGLVMIFASITLIPKYLKDASPTGAAWVLGQWSAIIKGLVIGLIIGVCIQAFILISKHYVAYKSLDPLNQMAFTPGLRQWVTVVLLVLLIPPLEEMMFRGILYGGYRKSFGPVWAAVSTTLIFVAMHYPSYIHFPSHVIGIIALALATLWCRLRWNAIGPAIAVHLGYNSMLALFVVCWTWLTNHS